MRSEIAWGWFLFFETGSSLQPVSLSIWEGVSATALAAEGVSQVTRILSLDSHYWIVIGAPSKLQIGLTRGTLSNGPAVGPI